MRFNEGIRVIEVENCLLCNAAGVTRYDGMRDKLFGVPGVWSMNYCAHCDLGWLHPRPIRSELGKIYRDYYTHDVERGGGSFLSSLKNKLEDKVLSGEFGYNNLSNGTSARLLGRLLARLLPMAKEIAGSSV